MQQPYNPKKKSDEAASDVNLMLWSSQQSTRIEGNNNKLINICIFVFLTHT